MTAVTIDPMLPAHWEAVRTILQQAIDQGTATFETAAPDWEAFDAGHRADCRLVARLDNAVLGWAALTSVSARRVYAGVAEVSVYVTPARQGQGIGRALLDRLIAEAEAAGIWTLQATVFPENTASLALHAAAGFREVGRRTRIARLHGTWRDTVLLERRSARVGTA